MKPGDPGYTRHSWGYAIDDAGKLLPKSMFPEHAHNRRKCKECGCLRFDIGPSAYLATRNPGLWKEVERHYITVDGDTVTERPNCLRIPKTKNPVEKTISNKELADSMVAEFKEKMDSHAVDPAVILEGIRKKYLSEADEKLDELQKQKEHWLTLKHNLSK